jgi:TM2 domain-containing membrane protein YozV
MGVISPMKSKSVAYLLLVFLGWVGGHRFYLGKIGSGVLYALTLGLLGFGLLYDLFTLGSQVDLYNLKLAALSGANTNSNANTNTVIVNVPTQAPAAEQSLAEKLNALSNLKDKGALTQEEFEEQKRKLLGGAV